MKTKKLIVRMLALAAGAWTMAGAGVAAAASQQVLAGLPPEQRQQMRQQMREHWQQMPPEQRETRRQEFRERWQQVPSDERQRMREEMREHRGGGRYFDGRGERR